MQFNIHDFQWIREPERFRRREDDHCIECRCWSTTGRNLTSRAY